MAKWLGLGCLGVLVVVVLIVGGTVLGTYNNLVSLSQAVDSQWAQVENQYQRRADLIPNLVKTVEGAANFEKSTLEQVVKARASVGQVNVGNLPNDPAAFARFQQAQDALSSALSRLMVVVERYPDLKANQNFRDLQEELVSTENKIGFARQHYNNVVENYNTKIQTFPAVAVAGMLGFKQEEFFELEDPAQREAVKVKF
jgi:LemA protein